MVMKYFIDKKEVSEEEFNLEFESKATTYLTDTYDEKLDASFEPYYMGDLVFTPSEILYNCNMYAYESSLDQEIDISIPELKDILEEDKELNIQNTLFELIEE